MAVKILGKLITSVIGLIIIGFALFCAVWLIGHRTGNYLVGEGMTSAPLGWPYLLFGLFCVGLFGFLGLTITLAPWRGRRVEGEAL